jgi:RNA polymerase sigma factor (sigma-70 family)
MENACLALAKDAVDIVKASLLKSKRSHSFLNKAEGSKRMMKRQENGDRILVEQCLSGSKPAWDEFYSRFIRLIRNVISRYTRFSGAEPHDIEQDVFVSLITALRTYDSQYPLSRFVCVVAERVCTDQYRKFKAGKRTGTTVPVDHHDNGDEGSQMVPTSTESQEKQVSKAEELQLLKRSFSGLGDKCRQLLRLRFYEDLSLNDISGRLGVKANTLAVQTRRCLDELKALHGELEQKGSLA